MATEEELMGLEREGTAMANALMVTGRRLMQLAAGSDVAGAAVLAGYLRVLLADMPQVDPVEVVEATLAPYLVGDQQSETFKDLVLDRLGLSKGALQ